MMEIRGSPPPPVSLMASPQPPRLFFFSFPIRTPAIIVPSRLSFSQSRFAPVDPLRSSKPHRERVHLSVSGIPEEEGSETLVQDLQVPEAWLVPSKALEESEWLRITLHKWLDDEYCPEPTNFKISKLAAQSYYESLISKETDLGEILLKIVRRLETISFQQSFHGSFSSANAAVHLITQRIDSTAEQ
ncbi:uncharacterized protein LOC110031527 isoform X1 [Phalaenopsis equestris]|uniref:uncharacterized protein LOC110031527 isoform X1 n=1 Tax=Phalaenopsis equestris TaxID=78828 RepID=UPI0009E21CA0|nr:uncharacterized protein LOC110031527 isoform X1 [Phalaenopsis equestris]